MEESKANWNDISLLEGLEMDWQYEPDNPQGERAYTRLSAEDLYPLFKKEDIPVKLVTQSSELITYLVNISQGGVCVKAKQTDLQESQLAKIGFILGSQKVISQGRVKYVRSENDWFLLGLEFVGLSGDDHEFLASLYTSFRRKESGL
ncbi:MAG: PilZ domain-containing protein [Desulfobacterales bacterium]|nr:PilZ domain-containing protein [Deltaproteobacteria bacterium]NNK93750.1 PilZ domain-containing protein [Desulfobacterales bacterium]